MKNNLGRILFVVPFGVFGMIHLTHASEMASHVPGWLPGGAFWVMATGAVFLLSAILVVTKRKAAWGFAALAALLVTFILTVHLPSLLAAHGLEFRAAIMNLLKDVSLLGGALSGLQAATAKPAAQPDATARVSA